MQRFVGPESRPVDISTRTDRAFEREGCCARSALGYGDRLRPIEIDGARSALGYGTACGPIEIDGARGADFTGGLPSEDG